jgi:trk system potassium uptake protein TrkH
MNLNVRYVLRQLGVLLGVFSGCMLAAAGFQLLRATGQPAVDPAAMEAVGASVIAGGLTAVVLGIAGKYRTLDVLGRREALLLVSLSWLVGAALAGLPYLLWAVLAGRADDHPFGSPVSCYFEAMSGLTTTGATVLADIQEVPEVLLLWRAMTQWLGGLGIVVLFVAVLPTLGVGGKRLFQTEVTGPKVQGVRPRIRETARVLWGIYLFLTAADMLALKLCGLTWFDAICHTFTTLPTGGFGNYPASIAHFDSVAVDLVTTLFMALAGINFGLYYYLILRRPRLMWQDPQLRLYVTLLVGFFAIVSAALVGGSFPAADGSTVAAEVGDAMRYGAFQVVSIMTTTGYVTADFNQWPFLAKALLVVAMLIGGSAGSTSGGIKVVRVLLAGKLAVAEVERNYRPQVVRTIRLGRSRVDASMRQGVLVYVVTILVLFVAGAIGLQLLETDPALDYVSAMSASAATLNNIGPGLGMVGAVENYAFFSATSKGLMSLLMVLGRLEVYALLVLLAPRFWTGD